MTFVSRARYWLPLLPLLGLLGITYWLEQQVRPESAGAAAAPRHEPDGVMENFSAVRMNEQGRPRFVMAAARMTHYPDDDSSTLDTPRLTSLSAERPAIHVVARRGMIAGNGDEVRLYDDVEVLREADAGRDELTLQTDYLRILPDRDWADTDRPVLIFDGRNTINGVGMEMDNKARTVKLLSQVRSVHEPR